MKISEYRPATESDFPTVKDKVIFEVIAPTQKAVKQLVQASQGRLSGENLNEELIQIDLADDTWTTIELQTLSGVPVGIHFPVLVDWSGGLVTGWIATVVDATHIKVRIKMTADAGYSIPASVTTRILVRGS
jgi:hypothetical protein